VFNIWKYLNIRVKQLCVMMHKGEIIEKAVRESNVPVALIAKKMNISRGTIYNIFDRIEVDNDTILKIGAIIHYDFTEKLPKLKNLTIPISPQFDPQETHRLREEVDYWKGKYIALLEEYNKLLKG
jgi:DNA-binding Lrp family transcriptional regulator